MSTLHRSPLPSMLALLLVACGGGADDDLAPIARASALAAVPVTHVRVEGCVLDADDRPLALPVHALSSGGRLLASALPDAQGVYRMHVPARETVTLAPDAPEAQPLTVMTGEKNLSVAACLRRPAA